MQSEDDEMQKVSWGLMTSSGKGVGLGPFQAWCQVSTTYSQVALCKSSEGPKTATVKPHLGQSWKGRWVWGCESSALTNLTPGAGAQLPVGPDGTLACIPQSLKPGLGLQCLMDAHQAV